MKVLVTTWVFPTHGGVFTFLDNMFPHLIGLGHSFSVVAVEPSEESRRNFPHTEVNIRTVSQTSLPRPFSFPLIGLMLAIVRAAREDGTDVIFCQDPFFSGITSLVASRLLKIPLALADHGMITNFGTDEYWANFGLPLKFLWKSATRAIIRHLLRASETIYFPGRDILDRSLELAGAGIREKISSFPIGIDTDKYAEDGDRRMVIRQELGLHDETVAMFVGRLHVESGLDHLIDAVSRLQEAKNLKVAIVGDGQLRRQYEAEAKAKVPDRFLFLGYSERIPDLLKGADLFVFPKIFAGGYSVALREAMSTGLACIATMDVDSHNDIIQDGENGVLVPPGDGRSLAEAIDRLLTDVESRRNMGKRARTSIENRFDIKAFNDQIEAFLRHYEDSSA
jgi:glycosyltransferase involved in cell wall biosynthesis